MLTRLKIDGFKNLVNIDVRFGPFTCIAGANGVGKSNLFDAIMFLSALAEKPLLDAATSVRDEDGRSSDIRSLFHHVGDKYDNEMSFEAEMIVPKEGVDDLGQLATAKITFLRYKIKIGFCGDKSGKLEIRHEELTHINRYEASRHLLFEHKAATWRNSAVIGRRSGVAFISTSEESDVKGRLIKLHADGEGGGRAREILAANLPRTVLSTVNAAENPTALMARREMQSWCLLQLEPAALRKPDDITAPTKMKANGEHLAATLYHLQKVKQHVVSEGFLKGDTDVSSTQIYTLLANRLAELLDDVRDLNIDYDEKRELLTLMITGRDNTPHSARSLSDGTLRFLALGVMELDTESSGLICLEEPENGIHPERIPAMLNLLQDIATDVSEPIGPDNPLRQVIINTHSPAVVAQIPDESLLVAVPTEIVNNGKRFKVASFCCLKDNWRLKAPEKPHIVSRGQLLTYLRPVEPLILKPYYKIAKKKRRVIDRSDIQEVFSFEEYS
jgi:predicted ATPase